MKHVFLIILVVYLSLPVFSQGAGGYVTRPKKEPHITQSVKKPQERQNESKPMRPPTVTSSPSSSKIETITVNGVSFNMVLVEGGTFMMGSKESDAESDEKPIHKVTLSSFMIGETEVTQELWEAVMGNNPSCFKGPRQPVEKVSWENCQNFIRKLNSLTGRHFRLPTEAEWEFAARGGIKARGYKYAGSNSIDKIAWYDGNSNLMTHIVATKQANELGLYDMSGNVLEWCQDGYGIYSSNSQTNPQGPSLGNYRMCRGGSFAHSDWRCSVSYRLHISHEFILGFLGLRLAL